MKKVYLTFEWSPRVGLTFVQDSEGLYELRELYEEMGYAVKADMTHPLDWGLYLTKTGREEEVV